MTMTPTTEFEIVCAAVASADEPLRCFFEALEPDRSVPRQYRRVMEHSAEVAFERAEPGTWTRAHSQFEVRIDLEGGTGVTITLPDHFVSASAATALFARIGYESIFHVRRLRHTIAIVLDIVFLQRLDLIRHVRDRFGFRPNHIDFIVSYEDFCNDANVLTFSHSIGFQNVLLPDLYYFDTNAYEAHKLAVLTSDQPWSERSDVVIWRGATTGSPFTIDTLLRNERIALADFCVLHPDVFDVKITGVVQTPAAETDAITAALEKRGVLGSWKPFNDFRQHKFSLHIDGNSSAFGLFEKFSLNCCVLKIESRFEQWFESRIAPWIHFVPIKHDLSDLVEKVKFLQGNPQLAERIAQAGFEFAMKADFSTEAALFIRDLARSLPVRRYRCVLAAPDATGDAGPAWHGIETDLDGTRYRWTATADISWPLDLPSSASGLLTVEILFRSEIKAGFAAESRIIVGNVQRPVHIVGRCLTADIPFGSDHPLRIVLRTPPPVNVASEWGYSDHRVLGLAFRVA